MKMNILRIHIYSCCVNVSFKSQNRKEAPVSPCRSSMGTLTAHPRCRTCCALPSWPATSACCRWAGTPASPWGWSCSCAWTSAPEVSSGSSLFTPTLTGCCLPKKASRSQPTHDIFVFIPPFSRHPLMYLFSVYGNVCMCGKVFKVKLETLN